MSRATKILLDNIHWLVLAGIIAFGVWIRSLGWVPGNILDFDPWWFFRHTEEILANGFLPPQWDILSFYPPGRPVDYYLGWSYTMALAYAIASNFVQMTLAEFASIFVAIFAALSAIPAYFVGKHVTNRWGGLATAFFATVSITFISVSLAGYTDSDAVDVFYTFLAVITTLYAIKKAKMMDYASRHGFLRTLKGYIPHVIPAVASYWLFAVNWSSSWYIYYVFVLFIPLLIIFKVIESVLKREHSFGLKTIVHKVRENRDTIFAILLIGFIGEAVSLLTMGWPFNTIPPHDQLVQGLNIIGTQGIAVVGFIGMLAVIGAISGLAFGKLRATVIGGILGIAVGILLVLSGVTGQSLIVNQSVAELQPINSIFAEFSTITARVGSVPLFFAFAAFFITAAKLIFRKSIHNAEYFAIIWLLISLFLITRGVRFSLLFSMAVATAAGFTIGNLIMYSRRKGSAVLLGSVFAIVLIGGLIHFNDNYGFALGASSGVDVSPGFREGFAWLKENVDEDSLIVTWWDPGHIIAGSTGLKVMADGAHCGPNSCIFLDHNSRIQDMGRVFSISDEGEALRILERYRSITPEQCAELQERFPSQFTPESCEPISEMYVLATSDLLGKYFWLSFFGTGQGATFLQCHANQGETQRLGAPTYVCGGVPTEISLVQQESGSFVAIMNSPTQGVRNAAIKDLILFQNGQQIGVSASSNQTGVIDGMAWVDPSFGLVVFMNADVRDSIFTNMFFFGGQGNSQAGIQPLERFELVYSNAEMKIYRVNFGDSI